MVHRGSQALGFQALSRRDQSRDLLVPAARSVLALDRPAVLDLNDETQLERDSDPLPFKERSSVWARNSEYQPCEVAQIVLWKNVDLPCQDSLSNLRSPILVHN